MHRRILVNVAVMLSASIAHADDAGALSADEPAAASHHFYADTFIAGGISAGSAALQLHLSMGWERRANWRLRVGLALDSIVGGGDRGDGEFGGEIGTDFDAGQWAVGGRFAVGRTESDDTMLTLGARVRPIDASYLFLVAEGAYNTNGDLRAVAGLGLSSKSFGIAVVTVALVATVILVGAIASND